MKAERVTPLLGFALLLWVASGTCAGAAPPQRTPAAQQATTPGATAAKPQAGNIHKASVELLAAPDLGAARLGRIDKGATVRILAQQGLWYRIALDDGRSGYVRINDVRVAFAQQAAAGAGMRALMSGKAGKGRVSETASVRGIDESDLRSAAFDGRQLQRMEANRVPAQQAAASARARGWSATRVAYAGEWRPPADTGPQATQAQKRSGIGIARSLLSRIGGIGGTAGEAADIAGRTVGKSEAEIREEELELGPQIAGRVLGAAPLWADAAAQHRVSLVGAWVAQQTSRPDLPWAFGIVDTPEVNAFAAPGGYVLLTRGLYQLLADDAEVAAVIAHELSHIVQRDHYEVIRKQQNQQVGKDVVSGRVRTGGGMVGSMAREYVERNGAAVMMTRLDRDAEYRADQAAEIYLARAGFNPMTLYAVLQKMAGLGAASGALEQLYKSHPPLDQRMDRIDRRGYAGLQEYTRRH